MQLLVFTIGAEDYAIESRRVIVVEFPTGPDDQRMRLGVAAENVLSLCSSDETEASLPTIRSPGAPALGRLLRIGGRMIQVLDVEHLLPPSLVAGLDAPAPASTGGPIAS